MRRYTCMTKAKGIQMVLWKKSYIFHKMRNCSALSAAMKVNLSRFVGNRPVTLHPQDLKTDYPRFIYDYSNVIIHSNGMVNNETKSLTC